MINTNRLLRLKSGVKELATLQSYGCSDNSSVREEMLEDLCEASEEELEEMRKLANTLGVRL